MRKTVLTPILCAVLAIFMAGIASSCGAKSTTKKYDEGSVVMYADEGFKSFMSQEIEVFEYQYPNAFVLAKYMSETDALNGLLQDSCQIAVLSRKLTKDQIDYIKAKNRRIARQQEIAVDAVALIVNKENPVGLLSVQDIKDLFAGKIKTWRQLAWNTGDSIKIVFDTQGSANVSFVEDNLMAPGAKFPKDVYAQKSNADVVRVVERDKSAIGIVSVSWLGDQLEQVQSEYSKKNMDTAKLSALQQDGDTIAVEFTNRVKVMKVRDDKSGELRGFEPYQAYINSGQYPLVRVVWLVSTASEGHVGHSFFSFVTGFIGQKILTRTGIMPYMVHKRIVELQ